MRSGWFWNTEAWQRYQMAYYCPRPVPPLWKSSPLAHDHQLTAAYEDPGTYRVDTHITAVADLSLSEDCLWKILRPSYRSVIERAQRTYVIRELPAVDWQTFRVCHRAAFGDVRTQGSWAENAAWFSRGLAMVVGAWRPNEPDMVSGAMWIIYRGAAYYASGPSLVRNVQHAVLWGSLLLLQHMGILRVELGQVDGETEKERNIGFFKSGFSTGVVPYQVVTLRKEEP